MLKVDNNSFQADKSKLNNLITLISLQTIMSYEYEYDSPFGFDYDLQALAMNSLCPSFPSNPIVKAMLRHANLPIISEKDFLENYQAYSMNQLDPKDMTLKHAASLVAGLIRSFDTFSPTRVEKHQLPLIVGYRNFVSLQGGELSFADAKSLAEKSYWKMSEIDKLWRENRSLKDLEGQEKGFEIN